MIRGFMQIRLFEKDCKLMIKGYRSFCLKTIKELHTFINRLNSSYAWDMHSSSKHTDDKGNNAQHYFVTIVKGTINELNYEFIFSVESPRLNDSLSNELFLVSENVAGIVGKIFLNLAKKDAKKDK